MDMKKLGEHCKTEAIKLAAIPFARPRDINGTMRQPEYVWGWGYSPGLGTHGGYGWGPTLVRKT